VISVALACSSSRSWWASSAAITPASAAVRALRTAARRCARALVAQPASRPAGSRRQSTRSSRTTIWQPGGDGRAEQRADDAEQRAADQQRHHDDRRMAAQHLAVDPRHQIRLSNSWYATIRTVAMITAPSPEPVTAMTTGRAGDVAADERDHVGEPREQRERERIVRPGTPRARRNVNTRSRPR